MRQLAFLFILCAAALFATSLCAARKMEPKAPRTALKVSTKSMKGNQEHPGLASACAAASASGEPVLAIFTAPWCGACVQMKKEAFDDKAFLAAAGPFHVVFIDIDADPESARLYRANAIPKLVVMSSAQTVYAERTGYRGKEDLLAWLKDARTQARKGLLLGSVDASTMTPEQAFSSLGAQDPQRRHAAAAFLMQRGKPSVPQFLGALQDDSLAIRIAACDALRTMLADCPPFDPWAAKHVRDGQAVAMTTWWQERAETEPVVTARVVSERTIEKALAHLLGNDPFLRTEACGTLRQSGEAALPALRQALAQAAQAGRHDHLALIENIRWSILLPEANPKTVSLRACFAHETPEKRIAAIETLVSLGPKGFPALRELVNDPDTAVQEAVAAALRKHGGPDAIAALASLLHSWNSNVRAVAAQELGHTKNALAGPHLEKILQDPDDVVACTAIAAIEEIKATAQASALASCLNDERWRVRAAALETIGKMELRSLSGDVSARLDDTDPFVITSALEALSALSRPVPSDKLFALSEKHPDLISKTIPLMLHHDMSAASIAKIGELMEKLPPDMRQSMMNTVLEFIENRRGSNVAFGPAWKPLFALAIDGNDPKTMLMIAKTFGNPQIPDCEPYLIDLLQKPFPAVRGKAIESILLRACHAWHAVPQAASSHGNRPASDQGILYRHAHTQKASVPVDTADMAGTVGTVPGTIVSSTPMAVQDGLTSVLVNTFRRQVVSAGAAPEQTPDEGERLKTVQAHFVACHDALQAISAETSSAKLMLARMMTATDMEGASLVASLQNTETRISMIAALKDPRIIPGVLNRLSVSDAAALVDMPQAGHSLVPAIAANPQHLSPAIRDAVLTTPNLLAHIAAGSGKGAEKNGLSVIKLLFAKMPAASEADRTAIRDVVQASTSAFARCAALSLLASAPSAADLPLFEKGRADADSWTRRAAFLGLYALAQTEEAKSRLAVATLADTDDVVAISAASALLQEGARQPFNGNRWLRAFLYETHAYMMEDPFDRSSHPRMVPPPQGAIEAIKARRVSTLKRIEHVPTQGMMSSLIAGIIGVRANLPRQAHMQVETRGQLRNLLDVLLVQYGDKSVIEKMLSTQGTPKDVVVFSMQSTGDPRFLPRLREPFLSSENPWELREALGVIRGMHDPETRQLRREINAKILTVEN